MPPFHQLVILFTRHPQVGRCKSRLIPFLGAEGALKVYKSLVSHVLNQLQTFFASEIDTDLIIFFEGGSLQKMQDWTGEKYTYKKQRGENIGDRMADALLFGLKNKQNTILIGSDCPDIDDSLLKEGFQALINNDLVIGPAHDGGYYLIGVSSDINPTLCKKLFEDIQWSTDTVFLKTLALSKTFGLRTRILKKLHDIDTEDDLRHFNHCSHAE